MNIQKFFTSSFFAGLLIGILTTSAAADMLGSGVFPDVESGSYYDAAVGRLYGQGIIKGAADGNFHPGDFVTRADVAVMFDRAMNGGGFRVSSSSSVRSSSSTSSSVESSSSVSSSSSTSSSTSSSVNIGEAGAFRFQLEHASFPESAANATLSVQRYGGTKGSALVKYTMTDGTAKADKRYTAVNGQLAFGDGETSKTITLKLINNLIADPNETFIITLSDPTGGAVIGTPAATTVTVLDNDGGGGNSTATSSSSSTAGSANSGAAGGVLTFSAWAYALDEGAGSATITVIRKGSSSSAVNVDYATVQGTATVGINYTESKGTLNFGANETSRTFTVPLINNTTIDGNKNLTLKITNPTGGSSLGDPNSVQLTVVDDEASESGSGTLMFSTDTFYVTQKDGGNTAVVTVYRRGGYPGTVTVNYSTTDSTAIAGSDYTATSGTLTFAPGESNKTFTVPITSGKFTGTKRINLSLGTITGPATLGSQSTSSIVIEGQ